MRLGLDYVLTPDQPLTLAVQPRYNRDSSIEDIVSSQDNVTTRTFLAQGNTNHCTTGVGATTQADFSLAAVNGPHESAAN